MPVRAGGGPPGIDIVGLPPANLPKESGRYDLPIALGILAATDQLRGADLERCEFAGERARTGAGARGNGGTVAQPPSCASPHRPAQEGR